MTKSDDELIEKVESRKKGLMVTYDEVHKRLSPLIEKGKGYDAAALAALKEALDSPAQIAFSKAVAVLHAIMGSTSAGKLQLERFYSEQSVGTFVHKSVRELELTYHELSPFLYKHGWLTRGQ